MELKNIFFFLFFIGMIGLVSAEVYYQEVSNSTSYSGDYSKLPSLAYDSNYTTYSVCSYGSVGFWGCSIYENYSVPSGVDASSSSIQLKAKNSGMYTLFSCWDYINSEWESIWIPNGVSFYNYTIPLVCNSSSIIQFKVDLTGGVGGGSDNSWFYETGVFWGSSKKLIYSLDNFLVGSQNNFSYDTLWSVDSSPIYFKVFMPSSVYDYNITGFVFYPIDSFNNLSSSLLIYDSSRFLLKNITLNHSLYGDYYNVSLSEVYFKESSYYFFEFQGVSPVDSFFLSLSDNQLDYFLYTEGVRSILTPFFALYGSNDILIHSGGIIEKISIIPLSEVKDLILGGGSIRQILTSYNPEIYPLIQEKWALLWSKQELNKFHINLWDIIILLIKYTFRQPASFVSDGGLDKI